LEVVGAIEYAGHPKLGTDVGLLAGCGALEVPLSVSIDTETDVVIDFSVPNAAEEIARRCVKSQTPLVMATTGIAETQQSDLRAAASNIALLQAPNMSLAVNLVMKLADVAARALAGHSTGTDVEIIDRHHRYKEDAPSGTALKFGEIIAAAMGQTNHTHGREGRPGARPRDEIGYHALRVGDNPGEHTIVFAMLGESIELTVRATSRDCYALGALAAAKWIIGKPPGLYSMNDVLGL
jgi:4-hydroxy-tetrahydrodipicolinate reductase